MDFSYQVIHVWLQVLFASTILITVGSLPTTMTSRTNAPTTTSSPMESFTVEESSTDLSLVELSVSDVEHKGSEDNSKSEEESEDKEEQEIPICEMPENRDPLKQPPKTILYQWQIDQMIEARDTLRNLKKNRTLLNDDSEFNTSLVNLTADQINQFLPFYRGFFRTAPLDEEEKAQVGDALRNRRTVPVRVCPALAQQTIPQLAFNSQGTISQIIQLNSMNINQIFFEEECDFSTSPLVPGVSCIQSTRLATAVVIDLDTFATDIQDIEIQSCVSVKYL